MANPRKPRHLKLISGTNRQDRPPADTSAALTALERAPPAPDWLPNSQAKAIWERYAPIAMRVGTLTEGTVESFAHWCAIGGKLRHAYSAGITPAMAMHREFRALSADFGLGSLAIAKPTSPGGPERPKNPFAKFRERPR
jgi:hypothetical protein